MTSFMTNFIKKEEMKSEEIKNLLTKLVDAAFYRSLITDKLFGVDSNYSAVDNARFAIISLIKEAIVDGDEKSLKRLNDFIDANSEENFIRTMNI